ncbi:MAG: protein TolR [Gemmatimonadetes bacterium]|nr:protein TolR [Gemmatimonadota bacterium]
MRADGGAWGGSPVPRLAGLDGAFADRMDVSPYVGVMLTLLILLMVITPSLTGDFQPPRGATAMPMQEPRAELWVGAHGGLLVKGSDAWREVGLEHLAADLRTRLAASAEPDRVYLRADQRTPFAAIQRALREARKAGVRRVGLIVELPRVPLTPAPR